LLRSAFIARPFAVVGAIGIQSLFAASGEPPATSFDATSNPAGPNARLWKYVPLSPAGFSPSRLNSLAMYVVAL